MANLRKFWKYLPIGSAVHYLIYEETPRKPSREYTIKTMFHSLYASAAILTAIFVGINQLPKHQNETKLEIPRIIQTEDIRDSSSEGLRKIIEETEK